MAVRALHLIFWVFVFLALLLITACAGTHSKPTETPSQPPPASLLPAAEQGNMNAQYELGAYYYREANQGIDTAVELTDAAMGLFKPEVPKEEPPGLHTWATIHYRYPSARLVLALRCRVIDTEDSAVLSESKLQSVTGYRRLTWWAEDDAKNLRASLKDRYENIATQIVGELMDLAER